MHTSCGSLVVLLLLARSLWGAERPDILVHDFEGPTYGTWKAEGEAFGPGPAQGTLPNQMPVSGYQGKGLVNSYRGGDKSTGTLTSPPLKVERKFIRFLIGGGKNPGKTCIDLLLEGKVVRTATGPNERPGGSEALEWEQWDVADLQGKTVVLRIVDQATGGWGHINIDHILQTDKRLPQLVINASKTFTANKRYLNLPVKVGAKMRHIALAMDQQVVRSFEIQLADASPDFWVFLDLQPFQGKSLVLRVDRLPDDSRALGLIEQADTIKEGEGIYKEKLRPQVHFSSRRGWLNDPNGLVYSRGEYHLFYQHNPYGWGWGNMHWGHAVSPDLVHWKELPIALYPQRFGDWCFSGSAVVDHDNTAGFKKGTEEVLALLYTSTGRGECLAYSTDGGRTFTDYDKNPVVKHQGRDPRVLWHAPSKRWVMAVYDEQGKSQGIAFYTSPDLKQWERQSRLDGWFECPELFELPVEGEAKTTRWILFAANNEYAVGTFDGKVFKVESGKHRGNFGNCLYAAQTYSNIPRADGRRIQIGWARIDTPGMPFNQMMTFPVAFTLHRTAEGMRLLVNPVREIEKLHGKTHQWNKQTLATFPERTRLAGVQPGPLHLRAEIDLGEAQRVSMIIDGKTLTYDRTKRTLTCQNATAPLKLANGRLLLEIIVDRTSLEIFADKGRVYMPIGGILDESKRGISLFAEGGKATLLHLDVAELKSGWE